jgi:xylan 1,4-beta-xylosidase
MGTQLRQIARGFEIIASNKKYKDLPIIIGESDPEGCAACGMTVYPQNGYRNGTMYSSYTASSFAKIYDIAIFYKVNLLGVVSWSFEFEDQPWFHGFRDLATNGVDKPVLNVFRLFGKMGKSRIEAVSDAGFGWKSVIDSGVRGTHPDINAIASKDLREATVMLWNYHDDDLFSLETDVQVVVNGIPSENAEVSRYVIDKDHSNSFEVWKKMGSPQNPTPEQYKVLEKAGLLQLTERSVINVVRNGKLSLNTKLLSQAVELLVIKW